MKPIFKFTLVFLFCLFYNISFGQSISIEKVDADRKSSFNIPVNANNLNFNSFDLKIQVIDSLVKIKEIIFLNDELKKNSIVKQTDYSIKISFDSNREISIIDDKIFKILVKADKSFVNKKILKLNQLDFTNNASTLDVSSNVKSATAIVRKPIFIKDAIVFGLLMLTLGFIFYTESIKTGFWPKFYKIVPGLFMAYMLPAVLTTSGLIAPEWETIGESDIILEHSTNLYYVASRYLLPAALVLMTLSIDLKAVFNLGWKALVMFLTGTLGIVIGGPIAILLVSMVSPETVGGVGPDAVWRGLSTLAGSWIGGGANQTAMLEIYGYNQSEYGKMVFVDIVVANIWMAIILIGIGRSKAIDKWLRADNSAIESLKEKVTSFAKSVKRNPSLTDIMIIVAIAFGTVSLAHIGANLLAPYFEGVISNIESATTRNTFTFLGSQFFWMISIATLIAILLSFTKAKNYEGAGASKFGSVFIYILVASIGMKIDLGSIFDNPGLIAVGLIWMTIHAVLLIIIAKIIKAPYFFLAVGSQANVGGAASAPIVASAFHPSLATVGVLLAVFGYAIGTIAAIGCTILMELAAVS